MTNASSSHVSLLHVLSAHMLARVFESARGARRGVLEGLAACLMLLGVAARRQVHGLGRWQYTDSADAGRRRDLRLDLLRGFAVFAMIVDHIGGESSWLYAVTGGDRFFVSAAELFVVVSALTMGLVYSKVYVRGGTRAILAKAARRTYLLYFLTVSLTLATALVAVVLELPWAPPTSGLAAAEFVWGVLSLQRAYYLTDVLLLYTLLVLFAGPVLAAMVRGYTWLVLAASWGVWAARTRNGSSMACLMQPRH
jgi:hypothetical protein